MTFNLPNGVEPSEIVLPNGNTASEVVGPDGETIWTAKDPVTPQMLYNEGTMIVQWQPQMSGQANVSPESDHMLLQVMDGGEGRAITANSVDLTGSGSIEIEWAVDINSYQSSSLRLDGDIIVQKNGATHGRQTNTYSIDDYNGQFDVEIRLMDVGTQNMGQVEVYRVEVIQ